jgi:hypothetical protein
VRRPSGDAFFVVSIPTEAFTARRVRYQDGAEICFLRLQRELASLTPAADEPIAETADESATALSITDEDLAEYRASHSPKTTERKPRPPQA